MVKNMVQTAAIGLLEEIGIAADRQAEEVERVEDYVRIFTLSQRDIQWSNWSERPKSLVQMKTIRTDPFLLGIHGAVKKKLEVIT